MDSCGRCHFRTRATSVPAEGPANGLDFARHCEFPRSGTFTEVAHVWVLVLELAVGKDFNRWLPMDDHGASAYSQTGSRSRSGFARKGPAECVPAALRVWCEGPGLAPVRPISVLRFWISEGLTQSQSEY